MSLPLAVEDRKGDTRRKTPLPWVAEGKACFITEASWEQLETAAGRPPARGLGQADSGTPVPHGLAGSRRVPQEAASDCSCPSSGQLGATCLAPELVLGPVPWDRFNQLVDG